jgi:hypothetical protein
VIVFDKAKIAQSFDLCDNFDDRRAVVFARNACWQIARDLKLDYFLQLDDDYTGFVFNFAPDLSYRWQRVKSLDQLFAHVLKFYKSINALSIALAQGGDLLGGEHGGDLSRVWLKRKCMNSLFCATARPFKFIGRINEDVTAYCSLGNRGALFFTLYNASLTQERTQKADGGLTDIYLNLGTYVKSFYTVMVCPSFVRIALMGDHHKRIHHKINWNRAVPKILDPKYRARK